MEEARPVILTTMRTGVEAEILKSETSNVTYFDRFFEERRSAPSVDELRTLREPKKWVKKSSGGTVWPWDSFRGHYAVAKSFSLSQVEREIPADERTASVSGNWKAQENFRADLGAFAFLHNRNKQGCEHIARLYAIIADESEIHLVMERCDDKDLFDVLFPTLPKASSKALVEQYAKPWSRQLLTAVSYMHSKGVGHRDINFENILLKNHTLKLIDFGQAVRLCSLEGVETRFFRLSNKYHSRAPECWLLHNPDEFLPVRAPRKVSAGDIVQVVVQSSVTIRMSHDREITPLCLANMQFPDAADEGKETHARPCGYKAAPSDVFSCGYVICTLMTQAAPWITATACDAHFNWARKWSDGMGSALVLDRDGQPKNSLITEDAGKLLGGLLEPDPEKRITAQKALDSPWLKQDSRIDAVGMAAARPISSRAARWLQSEDTYDDSMVRTSFEA